MDVMKNIEDQQMRSQVNEAIGACVSCIVVELETGRIVGSTAPADRLFGYIEGELVGKSIHELVPLRLREQHGEHLKAYASEPQPRQMGGQAMQLIGVRRDGTEFPVEIGLYPRVVAGKRAAVATILDMSVRHEQ